MYVCMLHDKEYEEQQQGNNINSKENIGINSQVFFFFYFISDILLFGEVSLCLLLSLTYICYIVSYMFI